MEKLEALLLLESAGELPAKEQKALDYLRQQGEVPRRVTDSSTDTADIALKKSATDYQVNNGQT